MELWKPDACCEAIGGQCVGALRHAGKCVGVVFGLARRISDRECDRPDRPDRSGIGLHPRDPRGQFGRRRRVRSLCLSGLVHPGRSVLRSGLPPRPQRSSVNPSDPKPTARFRIYQSRQVQRRWKTAPARLPEVPSDHWLRLELRLKKQNPINSGNPRALVSDGIDSIGGTKEAWFLGSHSRTLTASHECCTNASETRTCSFPSRYL